MCETAVIPPPTPSLSPHLSAARGGEGHFSLSNKNCPQKSEGEKRKEEFTFANKTFFLSLFSVQVGQHCTKLPAGVWILRRRRIVAQHGESERGKQEDKIPSFFVQAGERKRRKNPYCASPKFLPPSLIPNQFPFRVCVCPLSPASERVVGRFPILSSISLSFTFFRESGWCWPPFFFQEIVFFLPLRVFLCVRSRERRRVGKRVDILHFSPLFLCSRCRKCSLM